MTKLNEVSTKVKIFDQTYSVRGGDGQEYVERLAQYVDGKMRKISDEGKVVDTQKVAVLAALNIADDYYKLKREFEELVHALEERSVRCRAKLDEVLGERRWQQQAE